MLRITCMARVVREGRRLEMTMVMVMVMVMVMMMMMMMLKTPLGLQ